MSEHKSSLHTEVEKTTDKLFEFPFYNRKGQLNRPNLTQVVSFLYLFLIFIFYNIAMFIYQFVVNEINIFSHYEAFLNQTAIHISERFLDIQLDGFNALIWVEIVIVTLLLTLPIPFIIFILKAVLKKAHIQSNLASSGLEGYYLYKVDKQTKIYLFKLLKGHRMHYETFISQFDNLKQLFGEGDIEYQRYKTDMVSVRFKDELIDIDKVKASAKKLSLSKLLKPNKLLLGVTSLKGESIFASDKEDGKGLLNGHWLIVGASGSGKSVSMQSICMNFLLPENYRYIDDIYIINYKRSSDYNFLKKLDKVHYAQDTKESLRLLKQIQLNMFNKYLYNSEHDKDNFITYQTVVIIDEIQTLTEMLDSKGLHKIERNSIQESLSIIEMLGSKARASNISLMVILQKADATSLPSTAFRQNLRNRFMLKQENHVSASMIINSEKLEEENIRPLELKQGQFIYFDTLRNEVKRGLAIFPDIKVDMEMLNSIRFDNETQKVYDEVSKNKKASLQAIATENEELEALASSGKKTYYDRFDDIEEETINDILDEVEDLLDKDKSKEKKEQLCG